MGFSKYVSELFGKAYENVIALLGYNCSINQSIARKVNRPLVGCSSHIFNLCVENLLKPHEDVIDKLNKLMKKVRALLIAGTLRQHTSLGAKCNNSICWSSTAAMISRYLEIKSILVVIKVDESDNVTLSYREDKAIGKFWTDLKDLNSVTIALQRDNLTFANVRCLFDSIIERLPSIKSRLHARASIVRDPDFEQELTKNQEERIKSMTKSKKETVACFKLSVSQEDILNTPVEEDRITFTEQSSEKTSY